MVYYDSGDVTTLELKGVPHAESQTAGEDGIDTTEGTTNKSGLNDEDLMGLECDGN